MLGEGGGGGGVGGVAVVVVRKGRWEGREKSRDANVCKQRIGMRFGSGGRGDLWNVDAFVAPSELLTAVVVVRPLMRVVL